MRQQPCHASHTISLSDLHALPRRHALPWPGDLRIPLLPQLTARCAHAGGAWASAVGLSFAAQLSQNTPMTLKIFQTRIYAQAFTVAALCAAAAITVTEDDEETRKAVRPCLRFLGRLW